MSETEPMSTDWAHFYQHNLAGTVFADRVSDATVVTTTVASATASAAHLSPEGRISKPVRRRSRASRRTPTTLLNTDTTNFRAMVQQFTGGPTAAPFSSSQMNSAPSLNFGMGSSSSRQLPHPPQHGALMLPAAGAYTLPYQQGQAASYGFSLSPGDQLLLQRLGNPRGMEGGGVGSDGFEVAAPPGSRRAPPRSGNENGGNNSFLY